MERRQRQYRGISVRAAIGYLETLGGEQTDDATVESDDWLVTITTDTVSIGPTLKLTELTMRFEGEDETLDDLIEKFSQKAMRAGG